MKEYNFELYTDVIEKKKSKVNDFTLACITFLGMLVLFVLLRLSFGFGIFAFAGDVGGDIIFSVISQVVIMLGVPLIVFSATKKNRGKSTLKLFNFSKVSFKVVLISFAAGVLMYFLNIFIASFFANILSMLGYTQPQYADSGLTGVSALLFGLFFTGVLPGICEESAHRGMLLSTFTERLGMRKAIIYSSILFGLMHLNVAQFFYATVLGLIMAIATVASRSIWPAIILHFSNNALGVYFSVASENNWVGVQIFDLLDKVLGGPFGLVAYATIVYLLVMGLMKLLRMLTNKKPDAEQFNQIFNKEPKPKLGKWEAFWFYSCFVFAGVITLFTFIWGLF